MVSKTSLRIADDQVQVDPQLLFQRHIIAWDNSQLEKLFQTELCTYPTVLFNSPFMLRQPQTTKASTSRCTMRAKLTPEAKMQPKGNVQYVLDVGALLHRVSWPRGSPNYKVVRDLYCTYVQRKYGRAIVVFWRVQWNVSRLKLWRSRSVHQGRFLPLSSLQEAFL